MLQTSWLHGMLWHHRGLWLVRVRRGVGGAAFINVRKCCRSMVLRNLMDTQCFLAVSCLWPKLFVLCVYWMLELLL
jgi:hypothetical protein